MKQGAHGILEGEPPHKRARIETDNLQNMEVDAVVVEVTESRSINDLPPELLMEVQGWIPAINFRGTDKVQSVSRSWQTLENTAAIQQKRTRSTQFHEQSDKVANIKAEIKRLQQQLRFENNKLQPIEREYNNHCKSLAENKQFILEKMNHFGEVGDWNIESRFNNDGVNYVASRVIKNKDAGAVLYRDAQAIDPNVLFVKSSQGGNRVFINKEALIKALLNPNQANLQKLAATMKKIRCEQNESKQDESNTMLKNRI